MDFLNANLSDKFRIINSLIDKLKKQPDVRSYEIGQSVIALATEIELLLEHTLRSQMTGKQTDSKDRVIIHDITEKYSQGKIAAMLLSLGNLRYTISMNGNPKLALENNDNLEQIFGSDAWENFFQKLVNDPDNCSYMCKKKCGIELTEQEVEIRKAEEKLEVARQSGGKTY